MTTVYFGTNRRPNRKRAPDDFGSGFSDDGLANLRFGSAKVSGDRLDTYEIAVAQERLRVDRKRKIKGGPGSVLGSKVVFTSVRDEMIEQASDTIVFVHGYNVSFHEALTCAAKFKRNISEGQDAMPVNMVLFSWPSDGSMMPYIAYASDRQDAAASGPAFARGLLKLGDFLRGATPEDRCNQRLHLIAHSMGNYVLRHALQHYVLQSQGRPARLFDEVLLMAADDDDDAFEHEYKLKPLPRVAKRVNVYFNNNDRAMAISDKTKGNPDRLGDDGPRVPRGIQGKISLIDCTPVVKGFAEHSYFLDTPAVVADLKRVLIGTSSDQIDSRQYVQETNCYRLISGTAR